MEKKDRKKIDIKPDRSQEIQRFRIERKILPWEHADLRVSSSQREFLENIDDIRHFLEVPSFEEDYIRPPAHSRYYREFDKNYALFAEATLSEPRKGESALSDFISTVEELNKKFDEMAKQSSLDEMAKQSSKEHRELQTAVVEVGKNVAKGNATLEAMRENPHDSVMLFSKGAFVICLFSFTATMLTGARVLSPGFALFGMLASLTYGLMAFVDKRKRGHSESEEI